MKNEAFALFFVLVMITFLGYLSLSTWYKMSFLLDIAVEREKFYKNFYKTEKLFEASLSEVGKNFNHFLEQLSLKQKPMYFNCTSEKIQKLNKEGFELNRLEVCLELDKAIEEKKIYVALELKEEGRRVCRLSCLFSKKDKVKEEQWRRPNSNEFIIDRFTINDTV